MTIFSFFYNKILLNQVVLSFFSGIMGALIAGVFAWWATKQAYKYNQKIEEERCKTNKNAVKTLIKESITQVLNILNKTFEAINNDKSPYGYINKPNHSSKYIFPLLDEAVKNIGIIDDENYQKTVIQIYTELKLFLDINNAHKESLARLKAYRKENLNQDVLWNKSLLDYFDIDKTIMAEQNKQNSKIDYEFFKYQQLIIDDLIEKSNIIEFLYQQLKQKIEKFLEINNERNEFSN